MKMDTAWRVVVGVVFLFMLAIVSTAQADIDPTKVQKLLASDGAEGDEFSALSVAVDGNTAVIGAYGDDGYKGSAYVFVRAADGTWTQQAKLLASDGEAGDLFGCSVAVFGDTAVIGADGDDDKGSDSSSAYVFVRAADGAWTQQAKLLASDGVFGVWFGYSVAVSEDTAVIGATHDDDKGTDSGSAYVFVRAADGTWTQQAKLLAPDGAAGDWFGNSVALSGDTALIGAVGGKGSAYVFVRAADGTWTQQAKLLAPDGAADDWFGVSVALSGNTALLGAARDDDDKGNHSGSAYVFVRAADGTWSQQTKLLASDGANEDHFGVSVAVSGETAVIGVPGGDGDKGSNSGSAYVFILAADGTWTQQAKLLAPDGVAEEYFGRSVAVSGDTAVIGAGFDDDKGENSGSAYVFGSAPVVPPCSAADLLQNALATVQALPPTAFKTSNMQHGFVNQINTAILRVKRGKYASALHLVRGGILVKTDGCAKAGAPDKNDWLKDCTDQATVYALLMEAIECLESMI